MAGRAIAVGPDDAELARADGIVAGATRLWNADAFALAPQVRVISRTGIGYDNVDVAAANAAGVAVCYAPDAPSVSTAEHTLALLLAITKGLPAHQARAVQGLPGGPAAGLELDGAVLGVVGLGRIARRVAVAALAMGMQVVASDPLVTAPGIDGVTMVDLGELIWFGTSFSHWSSTALLSCSLNESSFHPTSCLSECTRTAWEIWHWT